MDNTLKSTENLQADICPSCKRISFGMRRTVSWGTPLALLFGVLVVEAIYLINSNIQCKLVLTGPGPFGGAAQQCVSNLNVLPLALLLGILTVGIVYTLVQRRSRVRECPYCGDRWYY